VPRGVGHRDITLIPSPLAGEVTVRGPLSLRALPCHSERSEESRFLIRRPRREESEGRKMVPALFYFLGEAVSHRKRSQVYGRRAVPHETACGHNHRRRQADALPAFAASTRRQIDLSGEGGLYAGKRRPTVAGLAHADSAAGSR